MIDASILGVAVSLAEGQFFSARLPSRFTTKKFQTEELNNQKYLVQGLIEANVLSIIVLLLIYYFTQNYIILIIPFIILILLNVLYLNDIGILKIY